MTLNAKISQLLDCPPDEESILSEIRHLLRVAYDDDDFSCEPAVNDYPLSSSTSEMIKNSAIRYVKANADMAARRNLILAILGKGQRG